MAAAGASTSMDVRIGAGVQGPVEILRDRAGVPHVYALSTRDGYFGVGLVMAQDRLWQIDRLRRRALGRQAEILGPEYVKSDLAHLLVGIDRIAAAEAARLSGSTRELLEGFVSGVNRWIQEATERGTLPPEFHLLGYAPEPFTVRDVVAILRGMWWSLNGRLEQIVAAEAARLLPDEALRAAYLTPEAPEERIVPTELSHLEGDIGLDQVREGLVGMGDATGSNNWALGASRSASGHAMLCSDPHQPFWLPASWYEYVLHAPEEDVAGAAHPGVPGIWFGSNGTIAWGITNNAASTRDLYVEEVDPQDPSRYGDGGSWRRIAEREVAIPVRGEAPRRFTIRSTVRGPVMNDVLPSVSEGGDPPLSLRWVGQEALDDIQALISIGRAKDWPQFRAALRGWTVPVFNFGYADAAGTTGYQCAGRVPVRGRVARGYRAASEPLDQWQGYVPFDALPRLENPARGYVATANNRVAPDAYPYPLHGAWAGGHRAVRLREALDGTGTLDRDQMVGLQNDVKSCRAERLAPLLVAALEPAVEREPDLRGMVDTLREWDFRFTQDSHAALLFEAFMQAWQARVAAERFPQRLASLVTAHGSVAAQLIEQGPQRLAWFQGGAAAAEAALLEAARVAVARLRREYGDEPSGWTWGAAHAAHWRHPLSGHAGTESWNVGPDQVDGGADTVRNTGSGPAFQAASGAEYRLVVDFGQRDRVWAVQNTGNSGDPRSPHYADQFPDWLAGRYHVVRLDRAGVEADLESRLLIEPR